MKKVYTIWKNTAEKIGNFQITILFSLLYFLIVTPLGIAISLVKDILSIHSSPHWDNVEDNVSTTEKIKLQ